MSRGVELECVLARSSPQSRQSDISDGDPGPDSGRRHNQINGAVQELLPQRRQTLSRHTYDETLPGLTTLRILFPGLGRRRVSNRPQLRVYPAVQWCSAPDPGEFRRFDSVPAESTDSHEQFYVVIKLSDLLDNGPWTRRLRSSCTQAC